MRPKVNAASRYLLEEELGVGGMGIVRGAVDRRLGREVAIKTLRSDRKRRLLERRFLREACVQALLDHPAIVPVYDIGRDADGALYFSMKRVVGSTLDEIIGRLRSRDASYANGDGKKLLRAFATVCRAVHFAHQRGVVHRDLKPANVMLTDAGDVYVLDWGLAALKDLPEPAPPPISSVLPVDAGPDGHTPDGETVGTPGYLSPEQARGARVDARADIYALGAILFELLSLEPLHAGRTTATIFVSTLRGADARPSVRAPHRGIAPELDEICVRATALERVDRFQSLTELIDALDHFLDGADRGPAPEAHPPPARPLAHRTRLWSTLARALVLLVWTVVRGGA